LSPKDGGMHAGDPDAVRSWTARHGAALRRLVSAHAEFVDAVSGGRRATEEPPADDAQVAAAAERLLEAARAVAELPPVPDLQAAQLLARLLAELRDTVGAHLSDPAALRAFALRSSLTVIDFVDRLLSPG
jgi:hypothetical protein